MIRPTVGRVLHFYDVEKGTGPLCALITEVFSDTDVSCAVFNGDGSLMLFDTTSLLLVQPDADIPSHGCYVTWMPFQVKKATGSESGEKEAGVQSI